MLNHEEDGVEQQMITPGDIPVKHSKQTQQKLNNRRSDKSHFLLTHLDCKVNIWHKHGDGGVGNVFLAML